MLHPKAQITWIDQGDGGKNFTGTIDDLFQHYAIHIHQVGSDTAVIPFGQRSGPKVQVQDWTGWTELFPIWRHKNSHGERWRKISVEGHPDINVIVSEFEFIPLYDPDDIHRGFHGETKYGYLLKHPDTFTWKDTMRVRGVEDYFPDHPQFAKINVEPIDVPEDHGYQVNTVSKFISMNGFHLYASDEVDLCVIAAQHPAYK